MGMKSFFSRGLNLFRTSVPESSGRSSSLLKMMGTERSLPILNGYKEETDYKTWSHEDLLQRVTQLEKELKSKNSSIPPVPKSWKKRHSEREFDPSKYSTRLIALKLAYLGKNYNGFEHHANNSTPLPTIEEELWKALCKARLIFPKEGMKPLEPGHANWEGCDYSKCGRTDRGVSAFGQVIGIRVRSNQPLGKRKEDEVETPPEDMYNTYPRKNSTELASLPLSLTAAAAIAEGEGNYGQDEDYGDMLSFDPVADELPYAILLNRLLPPDIRILAWCPAPPLDFSARFSCKERQYKYFFTQPAFAPMPKDIDIDATPGSMRNGWLNIEAMQEAAQKYVGLHDFRNFCKVDPAKQITNYQRRIYYAAIEEVPKGTSGPEFVKKEEFVPPGGVTGESPKVYTFTLHGSAFLWHQVRHMVAILFLVGQGLESPSLVDERLDVEKNPCRPMYELADDTPLVLWNCIFPREGDEERKDAMDWLYVGDERGKGATKWGPLGLMESLWEVWRERKIDEILASNLIDMVAEQGVPLEELTSHPRRGVKSQKVFDGGNVPRLMGKYLPVMKKKTLESVEVVNRKYANRMGFETSEEMKRLGYRRLKLPAAEGRVDTVTPLTEAVDSASL